MRSRRSRGPVRRLSSVAAAGLLAASLGGCTSDGGPTDETNSTGATGSTAGITEPATPESLPLEVFVYNVEYGGDESTDAVIEDVDADVVGVLESYNRLPEIAENTGYPYYNVSLQRRSRRWLQPPARSSDHRPVLRVAPRR